MKVISKVEGSEIRITEDTQINAVKAEKILVASNVTARFFGVVTKEIVLEPGAKVYLHGHLYGNVVNKGGEIYIHPAER